jgi:hypothetical protein
MLSRNGVFDDVFLTRFELPLANRDAFEVIWTRNPCPFDWHESGVKV